MGRIDRSKFASVGFVKRAGSYRVRRIHRSDTGRAAGFEVDHSDGRVAAVVRPDPVRGTADGGKARVR